MSQNQLVGVLLRSSFPVYLKNLPLLPKGFDTQTVVSGVPSGDHFRILDQARTQHGCHIGGIAKGRDENWPWIYGGLDNLKEGKRMLTNCRISDNLIFLPIFTLETLLGLGYRLGDEVLFSPIFRSALELF